MIVTDVVGCLKSLIGDISISLFNLLNLWFVSDFCGCHVGNATLGERSVLLQNGRKKTKME
jgi:hypothetical protein